MEPLVLTLVDNKEVDNATHIFTATFETGLGQFRTINTVEQAGRYLLSRWPIAPGPLHLRARQVCLEALQGDGEPAKARDAFIAALAEADIFIPNKCRLDACALA